MINWTVNHKYFMTFNGISTDTCTGTFLATVSPVCHWHIVLANANLSCLKANWSFKSPFPIMSAQLKTVLLIKEATKKKKACWTSAALKKLFFSCRFDYSLKISLKTELSCETHQRSLRNEYDSVSFARKRKKLCYPLQTSVIWWVLMKLPVEDLRGVSLLGNTSSTLLLRLESVYKTHLLYLILFFRQPAHWTAFILRERL